MSPGAVDSTPLPRMNADRRKRRRSAAPARLVATISGGSEVSGEVTYRYAIDAIVCNLCGKTAALHKIENRHTSSKAPMIVCEVGGAKRPIPGFGPGEVTWELKARACDGCGVTPGPDETDDVVYAYVHLNDGTSKTIHVHRAGDCNEKVVARLNGVISTEVSA